MTTRDHLHPAARQMLALPEDKRIQALQVDRWIDYPRAIEALARLRRLVEMPQRERMPCLVMHGPSNIGKTLIASRLLNDAAEQAIRDGSEQITLAQLEIAAHAHA